MPAAKALAASTFFAGTFAGLLIVLCCAAYYAPAPLRRLWLSLRGAKRRGDGDGDNAGTRLLPPGEGGAASPGAAEAVLRAQLARAADEVARLQALAFSSATGTSAVPEALTAAARALGGRSAGAGAGVASGGTGANAAALWDRREFLQATAAHSSLLLQLVDEHLVDALKAGEAGTTQALQQVGGGAQHPAEVVALAAAVHSLLSMAAAQAAALLAARRAAVAASSMGLPGAPAAAGSTEAAALLAQWAASAPFAAFFRASLELSWAAGAIDFAGAAEAVVAAWARALCAARGAAAGGAAAAALERALAAGAAREALHRAVALHLRLAVWPAVVQSGLAWGARAGGGAAPEPAALDSAAHVLFSVSGRALGEGAAVLFVGPELSGDVELRTRGNRALVFAA